MIEVLPEWTPLPAPEPAAPAAQDGEGAPALSDFSSALARAELFDNRIVDLPGAIVVLPYGAELLGRFRDRVHALYREHGLEEHDYPLLTPVASLKPVRELFDLDGKLLLVGSATDRAGGEPDMALLPTGEAAIYGHWAKTVRHRRDLPIRMYRRARYFRPVSRGRHAGRGPFYAMEHDDIFEFHCAYAAQETLGDDLPRHWRLLREVVDALHVPVLWSTRPPWTNRHEVAEWAIAADAPLPIRATTQVSALYNQGTRFSVPFGVGFREDGVMHHTFQLSGYVSRRLLLVHLLLGMTPSGRLRLHPDLAPVQVAVVARPEDDAEEAAVRRIADELAAGGMRARLRVLDRSQRMASEVEVWSARGTPLVLLAFARDPAAVRVVVRRPDTEEEEVVHAGEAGFGELVARCRVLVGEVGDAWCRRAEGFVAGRVAEAGDLAATRAALAERRVAVCPLAVDEAAVREVGSWRAGEVLGFCRAEEERRCVISGRPVRTVGLVSPRT